MDVACDLILGLDIELITSFVKQITQSWPNIIIFCMFKETIFNNSAGCERERVCARAAWLCVRFNYHIDTCVTDAIPLLAGETPVQTRVTWKTLPRCVLQNRGIANTQENECRLEANKPFRTGGLMARPQNLDLGAAVVLAERHYRSPERP